MVASKRRGPLLRAFGLFVFVCLHQLFSPAVPRTALLHPKPSTLPGLGVQTLGQPAWSSPVAYTGSSSGSRITREAQPVPVTADREASWKEGTFEWMCDDIVHNIGFTRAEPATPSRGEEVLLLPALSSISTREEMAGLQRVLVESGFDTLAVDWPGLGKEPKEQADWTPDKYAAFLAHVVSEVWPRPSLVVAPGHAAGYVLRVGAEDPGAFGRAAVIAPTWRGPLPTMLGGARPDWLGVPRFLVDLPLLGQALYRLNLNDFVVRLMGRRHVYSAQDWLDDADRMNSKRAVASATGARHASVRFVTGALDPFESAEPFLEAAKVLGPRLLVVSGGEVPARSQAEINALADVTPRTAVTLPGGKLGVHEEFPEEVGAAVLAFASAP